MTVLSFRHCADPTVASYSMGTTGYSGRGVKLTTHLHLVPRSRMLGTMHPLPQYALMAQCSVKKSTGTTLPLPVQRVLTCRTRKRRTCSEPGSRFP
jgi:hypothetical protein